MSGPSSVAGGSASLAASSTNPATATVNEVEKAFNGSVAETQNAEAAAVTQIQQKYSEERNKRIRPEGTAQYVDLSRSDKFEHFQDDPWIDPNASEVGVPPLTDGSRCKFLILGAGFGGLTFAVRLLQAGFSTDDIRIVDSAGGFGGTWYWNRYPGLMCDVESYIYMPLLEEMGYTPKHKYAYGNELREYAESIADKFELRDETMFRFEMKNLTWDDYEKEWVVKMVPKRRGKETSTLTVRARFVFTLSGLLNCPQLPGVPGIEKFQGHSFHTSRWDYKYTGGSPTDPSLTNLRDKKVAIIGTGATAIQAVPHLGKWAKKLYVVQRTPSSVDVRENRPTDTEWWAREIQGQKGWQRKRSENFNAFLTNASPPPPVNLVDDAWTKMPSFSGLIGGPPLVTMDSVATRVGTLHALDFPRQERIRLRVEQILKDKEVADKLKAWYPGWCKRPCFHDDYLPTFNLPNVTLVDTEGKGVDAITPNSIAVKGTEYDIDLLIFSTGFRSPSSGASPAFRAGMSIIGRDGQSLDEKIASGGSSLHGTLSRGFPNLFWPGPLQAGASANQVFVLDQLATHVAYIVSESSRRAAREQNSEQKFTIEPTAEAEEEWAMQILYRAAAFAGVAGCTPGYLNREGEIDRISKPEDRIKAARGGIWGEGITDYVKTLENWRKEGNLRGLEVTVVA